MYISTKGEPRVPYCVKEKPKSGYFPQNSSSLALIRSSLSSKIQNFGDWIGISKNEDHLPKSETRNVLDFGLVGIYRQTGVDLSNVEKKTIGMNDDYQINDDINHFPYDWWSRKAC